MASLPLLSTIKEAPTRFGARNVNSFPLSGNDYVTLRSTGSVVCLAESSDRRLPLHPLPLWARERPTSRFNPSDTRLLCDVAG